MQYSTIAAETPEKNGAEPTADELDALFAEFSPENIKAWLAEPRTDDVDAMLAGLDAFIAQMGKLGEG